MSGRLDCRGVVPHKVMSGRLDCRGVVSHKVSSLLKYSFQFKALAGACDRLSIGTTGRY